MHKYNELISREPAAGPAPVEHRVAAFGRRAMITGAAALAAAGYTARAEAAPGNGASERTMRITVLGTTDLHANIMNWDYYKDAEFDNANHDDVGIAKVATLVRALRAERKGEPILMLDAGDTIQGTPLGYYYARVEPITAGGIHPMAAAMNAMAYDAAALGNHEFNYGIEVLRKWESQLNFPLLGANAVDPATKLPVFSPYIVKTIKPKNGPKVKVGILGLTNPGIALWDKANVEGRMEFPGLVEQAAKYVPEMKAKGCDVVIVSAHSGADTSSSYGPDLPVENASSLVAQQVPDIDAILVGHAHVEIAERYVANETTGKQVLLTEPLCWGMRLSVIDLGLTFDPATGRWVVGSAHSQLLNSNAVSGDPTVVDAVQAQHDKVVTYVNSVIGTSTQAMSAARAVVEDVPIIDLINYVQADAVKAALVGSADESTPVLSIAAPFNRQASFKAGDVTLRDVAGLYIYDNTLLAVKVTGKDVRDYLEYSALYFKQLSAGTTTAAIDDVTNAVTSSAPTGTPDYNYDVIGGLDAPLTYDIDLAQPGGSRIANLAYAGSPLADDQQFVLAVNNYRQSGGGGFPAVKAAPVVYNRQVEIRQLIVDWVTANKVIDPATFASVDWHLVCSGAPLTVTD